MSEKKLYVPPGYVELLQDFTVAVIRTKPKNIVEYAADYFTKLKEEHTEKPVPEKSVVQQTAPVVPSPGMQFEVIPEKLVPDAPTTQHKIEGKKLIVTTPVDSEEEREMRNPETSLAIRRRRPSIAAESFDPNLLLDDDGETERTEVFHKTAEQRKLLLDVCKKTLLFRHFGERELHRVTDVMFGQDVNAGEKVTEQGEDGDNFFVIESGNYEAIVTDTKGISRVVCQYLGQGCFGELALMYNAPRSATVVAKTAGRLWCMPRHSFKRLVLGHAATQRQTFLKLLHSVTMLQELSSYERMSLADALQHRTYETNDEIIKEGEHGYELYFIMEGRVRIMRRESSSSSALELKVSELGPGGYFGELALINKTQRAASVYAMTRTTVAFLDVNSFERLLGPCMEVMKRNANNYEAVFSKLLQEKSV